MTDDATAASRREMADIIRGLQIGPTPDPARPDHVSLHDTWIIPVREIRTGEQHPCELGEPDSTVGPVSADWDDRLPCPQCRNKSMLELIGRWGEPPTIRCPECRHTWQLANAQQGIRTMMDALVQARPASG